MSDDLDVRLTNDPEELARLAQRVDEFCERNSLPAAVAHSFNLALEEAIANIIDHGYVDTAVHEIQVSMRVVGHAVEAEVSDDGRHFDPGDAPPPEMSGGIDRPIGGLGVFLIKRVMDDVRYGVVGGRNRLTLSKQLP